MKNRIIFFAKRVSMLIGILVLGTISSFAQTQCGNGIIPTNFATWNWEEPEYDPANPGVVRAEYCNTWQSSVSTGTNVGRYSMGAPWISPPAPSLQKINFTNDYKKANGWELVRFDFGGRRGTSVPYFVLYHKPTGVLRIFAYIVTTNQLNGIVFIMSHSQNNNRSTANLSLANPLVIAPDKYAAQSTTAPEVQSYVSFYGGGQSWAMGQFTMLFDPNSSMSNFNLSSYQFQIHTLQRSTVHLDGSFQFKTGTETSDFSFAGPAAPNTAPGATSGALAILASGQKFLGDLSSIDSKLLDIKGKSKRFQDLAAGASDENKVLKDLGSVSSKIVALTENKTLNGLTSFASQLGGFFGIGGALIGLFSDDATKNNIVPTVSKGTIVMDGTVTTETPLKTFFLLEPGTNHYQANSGTTTTPSSSYASLSYYTCPLGIFNIKTTPRVQKVNYERYTANYYVGGDNFRPQQYEPKPFGSYKLDNNIEPIVNAASGLEIVAVKFALAQKVPFSMVKQAFVESREYVVGTYSKVERLNFMYAEIMNGSLEVDPLDPGTSPTGDDATVIVRTPFMDPSCIRTRAPSINNSYPFNIPEQGTPIFVRVVAELRKINSPPGTASTYFSQDYNVDTTPGYNPYPNQTYGINGTTPITLTYANGYTNMTNRDQFDIIKTGSTLYNANRLSEISNSTLRFDSNSSTTVQTTINDFNPVLFYAHNSTGVEGTLAIPYDSELAISTSLSSLAPGLYECKPAAGGYYPVANQQCGYDVNANRMSTSSHPTTSTGNRSASAESPSVSRLAIAPNPAKENALISLAVAENECVQNLSLLSTSGQNLWQKNYQCAHLLSESIPLRGLASGLYIIRVTTSTRTYTEKLAVE